MRHSAQYQFRFEPADQFKQPETSGSHPSSAQSVNGDPWRQLSLSGALLRNQSKVQLRLFPGKSPRKQSGNLLSAAASEVRNQ